MRKREMRSRIKCLEIENASYSREHLARLTKEENQGREDVDDLVAEGYRPFRLAKAGCSPETGYLIGYQYSKDGVWLDIQTKGKLITCRSDMVVRFEVTDGVMIDR